MTKGKNMNEIVFCENQEALTTSLLIANKFNKRHSDILRAIKNIQCSAEFSQRNFALAEYIDHQGKLRPVYRITKDGLVFLVMGFTGKDAAKFKEDYINAFNEMYDFIKSQNTLMGEFNKALLEFEKFSDLASQAGRTLSHVGKKLKPQALEKVEKIKSELQPDIFIN